MGLLAVFIAIGFVAILMHINGMVFGRPSKEGGAPKKVTLPASTIVALGLAAVPVLVLGVYLPDPMNRLIVGAATVLTRVR